MSEKVITLQLRQKEAQIVHKNGDYSTTLSKPVIIEEGDTIQLFKSFIDTKETTSGRVILQKDTVLEFHYGMWSQRHYSDDITDNGGHTKDGRTYILCRQESNIHSILHEIQYTAKKNEDQTVGGMAVEYEYQAVGDPVDKLTKITYKFPERNKFQSQTTQVLNKKLLHIKGTFKRITPDSDLIKLGNMDPASQVYKITDEPDTASGGVEDVLVPYINSTSITIPVGDYEPTQIAQLITDKLTSNEKDINLGLIPVDNPFLKSTGDAGTIDNFFGVNGFTTPVESSEFVFVEAEYGGKIYSYNSGRTNQYWVGTSQMALEFLPSGRFQWSYTHMPYYNSANGAISIKYEYDSTDARYFIASANGGIFFNSLSASQDGVPFDFWEGIMGFNMDDLILKYEAKTLTNPIGYPPGKIKTNICTNLAFGKNLTKGDTSIDIAINKNDSSNPFYKVITSDSLPPISISLTDGIDAETPFDENTTVNYGYFMIELLTNYDTQLITSTDNTSLIKGIVSRYYSANSYTSGASDSSLTYIHKGSPVMLSNVGIRIKDSSGNVANDIGDDNSIFLQVFKKQ
jgi:hypothetical protein